jgi:hypothetical protein
MWKQSLEGISGNCYSGEVLRLNWQVALEYVEELNDNGGFAGYTDWRLPNPKELTSVIEFGCSNPSMNMAVFPRMVGIRVWSTTVAENYDGIGNYLKTWFSDNGDSDVGNGSGRGTVSYINANRLSQTYAVHLVRGAQ